MSKPTVVGGTTTTPTKKRAPVFDSTPMSKSSIEIIKTPAPIAPNVYYTKEAWDVIWYLVEVCKKEVGWLGLVDELSNGDYLITEIFIPKQEVTSVTTEMEPEALAALTMQLLDEGKDPGKLRYWGHSHVNMSVRPSLTDEEQIDEYLESADWFIRGIYNKDGDSKVDIYDSRTNLIHLCVDNMLNLPPIDDKLKASIDASLETNVVEPKPKYNYGYGGMYDQRSFGEKKPKGGANAGNANSAALDSPHYPGTPSNNLALDMALLGLTLEDFGYDAEAAREYVDKMTHPFYYDDMEQM